MRPYLAGTSRAELATVINWHRVCENRERPTVDRIWIVWCLRGVRCMFGCNLETIESKQAGPLLYDVNTLANCGKRSIGIARVREGSCE